MSRLRMRSLMVLGALAMVGLGGCPERPVVYVLDGGFNYHDSGTPGTKTPTSTNLLCGLAIPQIEYLTIVDLRNKEQPYCYDTLSKVVVLMNGLQSGVTPILQDCSQPWLSRPTVSVSGTVPSYAGLAPDEVIYPFEIDPMYFAIDDALDIQSKVDNLCIANPNDATDADILSDTPINEKIWRGCLFLHDSQRSLAIKAGSDKRGLCPGDPDLPEQLPADLQPYQDIIRNMECQP